MILDYNDEQMTSVSFRQFDQGGAFQMFGGAVVHLYFRTERYIDVSEKHRLFDLKSYDAS
jgi:hypothetical protein